jgi:hypothetical protein
VLCARILVHEPRVVRRCVLQIKRRGRTPPALSAPIIPSLAEIDLFLEHVLRVKDAFNGEVPMVLVGNKVDLEGEFQVTFAEAEQKARDLGCPLINASAKTAVNVTESFHECVRVNREKTEARPRTAKPSKRLFITRAASGFCSSCMRLLKLLPVLG